MIMKKLFVILLIVLSLFFSSCSIDYSEYFSASKEIEQVKLIEIYFFEEPTYDTSSDSLPNPIQIVEQSHYSNFVLDLATLYFKDGVIIFPPIPQDPCTYHHGYAVKILYLDNSYDLVSISFRSYNSTNNDSTVHYGHCDGNAFLSILQKYCDIEIQNSI